MNQYRMRGSRHSTQVERVVSALDLNAAVLACSKGKDFFMVTEYCLMTDHESDRQRAIAAYLALVG